MDTLGIQKRKLDIDVDIRNPKKSKIDESIQIVLQTMVYSGDIGTQGSVSFNASDALLESTQNKE